MNKIRLRGLVEEDFVNYKHPSMFLITCFCDFKCEKEDSSCETFCQNSPLVNSPIVEIEIEKLIKKYINNPISKSVVIGGLEPFLQFEELLALIKEFRKYTNDNIIIYTGYYDYEIKEKVDKIIPYNNIIIKYGRYKTNSPERYDKILGVKLSSSNQYACFYGDNNNGI